jgi:hypothetical protein
MICTCPGCLLRRVAELAADEAFEIAERALRARTRRREELLNAAVQLAHEADAIGLGAAILHVSQQWPSSGPARPRSCAPSR